MTLKELIRGTAKLVASREIIDHGSIRCLLSQEAVDSICSAEDCDEVDTGTIGDDDLAASLIEILDDADRLGSLDWSDLEKLERAHRGDELEKYLDHDKEDELGKLDALIDAARAIA